MGFSINFQYVGFSIICDMEVEISTWRSLNFASFGVFSVFSGGFFCFFCVFLWGESVVVAIIKFLTNRDKPLIVDISYLDGVGAIWSMSEKKLVKREVYLYLEISEAALKRLEKIKELGISYSKFGSLAFEYVLGLPAEDLIKVLGIPEKLILKEVKTE